jgi:protein involved in polysaccharide export with SLBB domain
MELLDADQCPTNIFSQVPKPESDGGFHQHFDFSRLCWRRLPNGQTPQHFPDRLTFPRHVILASGDVLKLTFSAAPELNQSQKVRADGKLSLPLVGEVDAAGKTIGQLQGDLIQLYKSQLKTPEVTVSLETSLTTVVVSGAVNHPSKIAFERPTTVFQAIMEAGGPSEFGTLKHVRLVRTVNGVQKSQVMNVQDTLIEPGDETFLRP